VGQLEDALVKVVRARPAQQKLRDAVKAKRLAAGADLFRRALAAGVITAEELRVMEDAESARGEALVVDAFAFAEYAEARG
jgi:acyl-CoA dehydrogenase